MSAKPAPQSWTVLIVEDDVHARRSFAQSVQGCGNLVLLDCLGSVGEVREWLRTPRQQPDVLLTDLGLPDGSGIDVIREVLHRYPGCEALVVSMFGDEEHVLASIEAGALGYVQKDCAPGNLADTILELKAGASPISPGIARRLLMRYRAGALPSGQPAPSGPPATSVPASSLTKREIEILDLLARGFSYAEIAGLCELTRNTVASHVKNLYRKMQVGSRSEAVFEGMQAGLIRPLTKR